MSSQNVGAEIKAEKGVKRESVAPASAVRVYILSSENEERATRSMKSWGRSKVSEREL